MIKNVIKSGGGYYVLLPKAVVESLNIKKVDLTIQDDKIVLTKVDDIK